MEPATVDDWAEVQELERDITLLYHQLARYGCVMGDLYYGSVFSLPYWDYVLPSGLKDTDQFTFVQRGCLMMILAMAWDMIDGSGCYLARHMDRCERALATLTPKDPTTERLASVVRSALVAARLEHQTEGLHAESGWAYHNVVRLYFKERAGTDDAQQQHAADDAPRRR